MKHSTRAITILAMFCCILGALTPPGAQAVSQVTSTQEAHPMTGEVEPYPNLSSLITPSSLSRTKSDPEVDRPSMLECGENSTLSTAYLEADREPVKGPSWEEHTLAAAISVTPLTQPPPVVERTDPVTVSYGLTYPNGSSVKTSAGSTVAVQEKGQTVVRIPLRLNQTSGAWMATWASKYSANLTDYSFMFTPADFSDSYGDFGVGAPLVSSSFKLIPARVTLSVEAFSTLMRRQNETITIPAEYHDGSPLQNATFKATIVDSNGTASPFNMTVSGGLATKSIDLSADALLGVWHLNASFADGYGNQGEGGITFKVVAATIKFSVTLPQPVERTTSINVTALVTYPDGQPLTSGVNGNVSIGNMTRSLNMRYVGTNQTWNGVYPVSQNATVGTYNVTVNAGDRDGNVGRFTTPVPVVQANFRFAVPNPQIQVPPLNLTDIVVTVTYPNGSALGDNVGTVSATYKNSTGGVSTMVLQYNATEAKWHILFYTPDQRFKLYSITLVFAFEAHDIFGNYGSESDALEMTVTTPINLLILAAIVGVIVPASLLGWAMMTVTKKRRKHKP